jgi:hypothetical protein
MEALYAKTVERALERKLKELDAHDEARVQSYRMHMEEERARAGTRKRKMSKEHERLVSVYACRRHSCRAVSAGEAHGSTWSSADSYAESQ